MLKLRPVPSCGVDPRYSVVFFSPVQSDWYRRFVGLSYLSSCL